MKKVLLFACVAMVATMVVSCGKKKLEGEQIETKYFTVTMPQGWEQGGASQPDLSCMIHTEGTGKQPSIAFTAEELNPNMKAQSAAEKKNARISMNGYVDKGEMTFNDHKYYGYYDEKYEKITLLTDLADNAVLRVVITNTDLENGYPRDMLEPFGNVWQTDVDFDGYTDVLICLGFEPVSDQHFVRYDAWLYNPDDGKFYCPDTFREIINPEVDREETRILSHYIARDGKTRVYSAFYWQRDGNIQRVGESWTVEP